MSATDDPSEIDALWEYEDPELSESQFRAAAERAKGDERLELVTQIARTHSLRGQFAEAHSVLDGIEKEIARAGSRARARYLLERGRTFNSAGESSQARTLFADAWELAEAHGLAGLAVDAAHMLAIVLSGTPEAIEWSERGLDLARKSADRKARALIPAMLNNAAWDLHKAQRYDEALALFREAQTEWEQQGRAAQIQVARWSVGRCLRSLMRFQEALSIQRGLEAEHAQAGTKDGYVFEEIAENLAALGNAAEAAPWFRRAYGALSGDPWFVENEPERLLRLKERATS